MLDSETAVSEIARLVDKAANEPRVLSVLFADYIANGENGKPLIIGIFDNLMLLPSENPGHIFYVYVKWSKIKEGVKLRIYLPSNNQLANIDINPPEGHVYQLDQPNTYQAILQLPMPLPENGTYWFDFRYENHSLGMFPLTVKTQEATDARDAHINTGQPTNTN